MSRGERRERCFFIETILGSCWTTCLPFLAARAESGVEVEKRAAVRDTEVGVADANGDGGVKIERMEAGVWKSRWSGARRLNVDAILVDRV
jgi:hypothetical protein